MVNLAKIRKKAKEGKAKAAPEADKVVIPSVSEGSGAAGVAEQQIRATPPPDPSLTLGMTSSTKLEKFKQEAGRRREVKRTATQAPAEEQIEALTFVISGENYAVGIEKIVEIVTPRVITRIPNADPFIVGIISLRGTVVTLLDLRRRLNHPPAEGAIEDRRVVVVDHEGETVGFEVDRVLRVVSVPRSEVDPQPVAHAAEEDESVRGVFRVSNSLTILLDLDKLLKTAAMLPAS